MPDHDASRIASQIVSGIGFLGAGIIFVKDNNSVSGLTTAAGIWATAGIGMSIGAGQYFVGISGGMLLVLLQELLHRVGFLSNEVVRTNVQLVMNRETSVQELEEFVEKEGIEIKSIKINQSNIEDTKVEMELLMTPQDNKAAFLNDLLEYPGIISVCG